MGSFDVAVGVKGYFYVGWCNIIVGGGMCHYLSYGEGCIMGECCV